MEMRQLTKEEAERVRENTGLVHYVVKKYKKPEDEQFDDYFSIGKFGLCKAVITFDEGKGYQFATYAARVIENEILMEIRRNRKHRRVVSLNSEVLGYEGNKAELQDFIADEKSLPVEESVKAKERIEKALSIILNNLTNKEKYVILFYVAGMTQSEVGERLNFSQSYTSRVIERARKKLDKYISIQLPTSKETLFSVVILTKIEISFPSKMISDAEQRVSEFLASNKESQIMADGEIAIAKDKVTIKIDMEAEALEFLAEFLYYFGL